MSSTSPAPTPAAKPASAGPAPSISTADAVKSCMVLAVQADGQEITTIEGVAPKGTLHPVQHAFWTNHGLQCGYCTPGVIMSTLSLLKENPDPSDEEIRHALEGNICRCTGYHNIVSPSAKAAAGRLARGEQPQPFASARHRKRNGLPCIPIHLPTIGPASIDEALTLLADLGDEGKVLAGGHSLLPVMKLRLAQPEHLIDIGGLTELTGVRERERRSGDRRAHDPPHAGDRSHGRSAGRAPRRDRPRRRRPAGAPPGHAGRRAGPRRPGRGLPGRGARSRGGDRRGRGPNGGAHDPGRRVFHRRSCTTALDPDELLDRGPHPGFADQHRLPVRKAGQSASGYALVGVAAVVQLDDNGSIAQARIGITGASDVAWRAEGVEAALVGVQPDDASVKAAAATVVDGVELLCRRSRPGRVPRASDAEPGPPRRVEGRERARV